MSLFKKTILFFFFSMSMLPVWGQRNVSKLDGFMHRLRMGGQACIAADTRIGREALNAGIRSRVGVVPLTSRERIKYNVYNLGQKHLSTSLLNRLVARQVAKVPFPAYYIDFPKTWMQVREQDGVTLRQLEVILEAAYGEETEFEGSFVTTYREVLKLWQQKGAGMTALGALKQAFNQGLQKRNGFFVIEVHGSTQQGPDVLLLDLKNKQFISMGKSIGEAWMEKHLPVKE